MTLEVFPLWMLYRDFEVPVGTVVMWPAIESLGSSDSKIPEGWKICNGQQLNRSDYQDLWNTIRLTYTVGDDSNTFNIPDLTNTFVRGTNPDYNSSTVRYSWSQNKLPGLKQNEEFKHSMINVTVTPELNIESYEIPVSFKKLKVKKSIVMTMQFQMDIDILRLIMLNSQDGHDFSNLM